MSYAQKDYNEIQGINGKYRINQIGCLLTSFCNLLGDLGKGVDPLSLNASFRDAGVYIDVDDGVRDDLAWNSITKLDAAITVGAIGKGNPPTKNVIVKQNLRPGVVHFSKVDHVDGSGVYIIDSYDGAVKNANVYGAILEWASYNYYQVASQPQPVAPPPPPPEPAQDPNFLYIKALDGYGISHLAKAASYPNFGEPLVWDRIAQANGFVNASQFHVRLNEVYKVPRYKAEDYLPQQPAPIPTPAPQEEAKPLEGETIVVSVKPDGFKDSYSENYSGKYRAIRDGVIKDLNNEEDKRLPDAQLVGGQVYEIAGWFDKGGVHYGRTANSVSAKSWHGIHEDLLEPEEDADLLNLETANEHRIELGNLTVVERTKGLFKPLKNLILRLIGKYEAKQNNKKGE
jgi:hypothetical protein